MKLCRNPGADVGYGRNGNGTTVMLMVEDEGTLSAFITDAAMRLVAQPSPLTECVWTTMAVVDSYRTILLKPVILESTHGFQSESGFCSTAGQSKTVRH